MNKTSLEPAINIKIPAYLYSLHGLLALVLLLSMVFGKTFTKFAIVPNVVLHDILLIGIFILSLQQGKMKLRDPEVLIILGLSFLYLIYSFTILTHKEFLGGFALRQYALFMYLFLGYALFNTIYRSQADIEKLLKLFVWMGKLAFWLSWMKILLIIFILRTDEGFDFRFYSYIGVLGVITYSAYNLIYGSTVTKYLVFTACLVLAVLSTQAAFLLAILVTGAVYLLLRIKPWQRFIFILMALAGGSMLFLSPNFTDHNVIWRLMYWKHVLHRAIYQNYLLAGNGFGIPYMTAEYSYYINNAIRSAAMTPETDPLARHLNPPHNSFITFIFHIGLIPFVFLLRPIRRIFNTLFLEGWNNSQTKYFLVITLTGSIIWCCFNVILELPHSSVYFWLIFFTTAYYLNKAPVQNQPE